LPMARCEMNQGMGHGQSAPCVKVTARDDRRMSAQWMSTRMSTQ
jgi:hypothetical protein